MANNKEGLAAGTGGACGINVKPERMRPFQPAVVEQLAESIQSGHLINAFTVRPRAGGGGYWLVVGLHRLTAHKKLKLKTIRAVFLTGLSDDEAELIQIDENPMRDLCLAERAEHQAARKRIYERLHPETKQGGDRGSDQRQIKISRGPRTIAISASSA